jgi:fluoride exporter
MLNYLYLAIGAVAGTVARYRLGVWITGLQSGGAGFPWGTFVINASGSLLLGVLMRSFSTTPEGHPLRLMLAVGFCGAYTTFSTFSYETMTLLMRGETVLALLYIAGSVIVSILFCYIGYLLGGVFA